MKKRTVWALDLDGDLDYFRWCYGKKGGGDFKPAPLEEPEKPKRTTDDPSPTAQSRARRLSLNKRTGRTGLRTDLKGEPGSGIGAPTRKR